MDNKEYYKLLKLQYYKATKDKIKTIIDDDLNENMYNWLFIRHEIGKRYIEYLNNLGYDVKTQETAEIGKGLFDTIVRKYETTIISPYIEKIDSNRVFTYSLNLSTSYPTLMKYGKNMRIEDLASVPKYINTFLINNPYQRNDLFGLENLINKGEFNAIIGMYGQTGDNDKAKKLKILYQLSNKIRTHQFQLKYEKDKDYYYASLISNSKIKKYN